MKNVKVDVRYVNGKLRSVIRHARVTISMGLNVFLVIHNVVHVLVQCQVSAFHVLVINDIFCAPLHLFII